MPADPTTDRIVGALQGAMSCRRCGGARALVTTPERFHAERRDVDPGRDCVCPGGPVWARLVASAFRRSFPLKAQEIAWRLDGMPADAVPFWVDREGWRNVSMLQWRVFLATNWPSLIDGIGVLRYAEGMPT